MCDASAAAAALLDSWPGVTRSGSIFSRLSCFAYQVGRVRSSEEKRRERNQSVKQKGKWDKKGEMGRQFCGRKRFASQNVAVVTRGTWVVVVRDAVCRCGVWVGGRWGCCDMKEGSVPAKFCGGVHKSMCSPRIASRSSSSRAQLTRLSVTSCCVFVVVPKWGDKREKCEGASVWWMIKALVETNLKNMPNDSVVLLEFRVFFYEAVQSVR